MTTASAPVASLVAVGNELLFGETVDTNAAWLGRWLAQLGVTAAHKATVRDVATEIQAAVEAAVGRADLVLVSGGLGPTDDDITKEAVAELLGLELRLDRALMGRLEERFRARGYDRLPEPNRSQAEVPAGATILSNPHGTAPGLAMEAGSALVVLLPGVPRELRGIVEGGLEELLRARFADRLVPVVHHTIHTTGVAESRLAEILDGHLPEGDGPVTVAFLPDLRGVDLRLTARGLTAAQAADRFAAVEADIGPLVARWRFEADEGDVVEAVAAALRDGGRTLAVAESCTGGLVAKRLTDRGGASDFFLGGVVAYSNPVKTALLGVAEEDLERHGAVSEPVARGMAEGVRRRLGADCGIGITGIAGPSGGTEEKPVGTVWISVAVDDVVEARRVVFPGDREAVRERAAQEALAWLLRMLSGPGGGA